MKCPNCGYEMYNNEENCPNCGENILKHKIEGIEEDPGLIDKLEKLFTIIIPMLNWKTLGIIIVLFCLIGLVQDKQIIGLWIFGIVILAVTIWLSTKIKDIVVNVGRKVLDFCTSLNVVISVVIIIIGFLECKGEYGISDFIWWYIGGAILYFLIALLSDYTLYVLIDIRDSLKKLADKADKQ